MSDRVFLVEPDVKYSDQFAVMVNAYKNSKETDYFDMYKDALEDFDKYVQKLKNRANAVDLPAEKSPQHSFWLINDEGEILGVTRVRTSSDNEFVKAYAGNIGYDISPLHRQKGYGKTILKLVLAKARALGLDRALITCNYDNVGSIKIIESNGGVFECEEFYEAKNALLRKYWIGLT